MDDWKDIALDNPLVKLVKPIRVRSYEQMQQEMENVMQRGGEGMIVRKPNATYREDNALLKQSVSNSRF